MLDPADVHQLLRSHRSIRAFVDAPLSDDVVAEIVRCGQAAATSSNLQATTVIRVTNHPREAYSVRNLEDLAAIDAGERDLYLCHFLHGGLCSTQCVDTPAGGAFTVAVAAGLRHASADDDGDGHVSVDELHEFVKRRLRAEGHEGTPQKWVWNVPKPIYLATAPSPVFLSYAREDMVAADQFVRALEAEGLSVWIDRQDIQSGSWKERVTEGLRQARAMVVLLTLKSLNSRAVRKELAFAAKKNVPIIPVQLQEINEDSVPDWYTLDYDELHRHILDAISYDDGVRKLASAIRSLRRSEGRSADHRT